MDPRLAAIARLVGDARRVVDVGCEHGRLGALLDGAWVLGIDRQVHLLRAAAQHGDRPRLAADGLLALAAAPELVVCAGMGERSMVAIIDHAAVADCRRLVLNPSPQPYTLRHSLAARGWRCADEDLVHSGDRYHVIIAAERGLETHPDPDARLIGPRLVERRHPLLRPYLEDCRARRARARGSGPEACFVAAASRLLDLA